MTTPQTPDEYRASLQRGAAAAALILDEHYPEALAVIGGDVDSLAPAVAMASAIQTSCQQMSPDSWPTLHAYLVDALQSLSAQAADNGWPLPPPPEADQ